jgi:hypothetical protein
MERRPLVLIGGKFKELPTSDTLPGVGGGGTVLSPSQITSWQNNYTPSGFNSGVSCLILESDGSFPFLTGLLATTTGHFLDLYNKGNVCIGLKHDSSSSSAANRFIFSRNGNGAQDLIIYPGQRVRIIYISSSWQQVDGGKLQDVPWGLGQVYFDDMPNRTKGQNGWDAWSNSGGTLSEALSAGSPIGNRSGVTQFSTAASSSAFVTKTTASSVGQLSGSSVGTGNYLFFETVANWPTEASDATDDWRVQNTGFAVSPTGTNTTGLHLRFFRTENSGNWQLFRNNVLTVNCSAGPIRGAYSHIRIVQYPNGFAEVWQDGVLIGSDASAVNAIAGPVGGNIYFYKNAGTTARIAYFDSVLIGQVRSTYND